MKHSRAGKVGNLLNNGHSRENKKQEKKVSNANQIQIFHYEGRFGPIILAYIIHVLLKYLDQLHASERLRINTLLEV